MRTRHPLFTVSVVLSALVAFAAACATSRGPAGASRPSAHPDVGVAASTETCASCHEGATPAIAQEWAASAHGLNLVKCFVCHGSTGSDFTRIPKAERCAGCHPRQAERVAAKPEASCVSCHGPHTLTAGANSNPHRS